MEVVRFDLDPDSRVGFEKLKLLDLKMLSS